MLRKFHFTSLGLMAVLLSGCATLVSKSRYNIAIESHPDNANITVKKMDGELVYKGTTPAVVKLKASNGFAREAFYRVDYEKPGYEEGSSPIIFKFDPWYLGNCLFPGIIGFLIDPLVGSMYKPEKRLIINDLVPVSDENKPRREVTSPSKWNSPSGWD